MSESTKPTSNTAENGNKSKPLLPAGAVCLAGFSDTENTNVTTKFNINHNCRNSTKRVLAVRFLN